MRRARSTSTTGRAALSGAVPALLSSLAIGVMAGCQAGHAETRGRQPERVVRMDRSDQPLAGATAAEEARFAAGDALFEAAFRASDGLGPVYIRSSCEACHGGDGRGPGLVAKMAVLARDGVTPVRDQSALPFGNTQRPYLAGGGRSPIAAPADAGKAVRVSYRLPPAVWGRGYLEAVSDAEIERLAAQAAARPGPIKGRLHRVGSAIGRFGLKARLATLEEFAADALQSDMGLTSPLRPHELPNPDGLSDDARPGVDVTRETVEALGHYVRLVEIPRRPAAGSETTGRAAFERAQCATCHVPALRTRGDYPVAALAGIAAPVYTDFLLHDMGSDLADAVVEGDAGPREWRTAPLMGLRFMPAFLHDGRAQNIEDAIAAHDGPGSEGRAAVAAFRGLTSTEREALLRFVRSL